jgi:hypothetical protein
LHHAHSGCFIDGGLFSAYPFPIRARTNLGASEDFMQRPGATKRQKELARAEKQREKAAKREQRKTEKDSRPEAGTADGVDPDIAGIVPGPQPRTDDI